MTHPFKTLNNPVRHVRCNAPRITCTLIHTRWRALPDEDASSCRRRTPVNFARVSNSLAACVLNTLADGELHLRRARRIHKQTGNLLPGGVSTETQQETCLSVADGTIKDLEAATHLVMRGLLAAVSRRRRGAETIQRV